MSAVVDPKGAVVRLDFEDDSYREEANRLVPGAGAPEAVAHVALQLAEYFDGRRRRFDLDLAPQGSDFRSVPGAVCATRPMGQSCPTATLPDG